MVVKDDWVRAAIAEDTMVAELLVRLKDALASAPIQIMAASARAETVLPPPRWGIRQPRSRLAFRCDTASPVKAGDSRRNSPTTPLSWSAGTASSSGTADCYEDSDLPACGSSRSKVPPSPVLVRLLFRLSSPFSGVTLHTKCSLVVSRSIRLSLSSLTYTPSFWSPEVPLVRFVFQSDDLRVPEVRRVRPASRYPILFVSLLISVLALYRSVSQISRHRSFWVRDPETPELVWRADWWPFV